MSIFSKYNRDIIGMSPSFVIDVFGTYPTPAYQLQTNHSNVDVTRLYAKVVAIAGRNGDVVPHGGRNAFRWPGHIVPFSLRMFGIFLAETHDVFFSHGCLITTRIVFSCNRGDVRTFFWGCSIARLGITLMQHEMYSAQSLIGHSCFSGRPRLSTFAQCDHSTPRRCVTSVLVCYMRLAAGMLTTICLGRGPFTTDFDPPWFLYQFVRIAVAEDCAGYCK